MKRLFTSASIVTLLIASLALFGCAAEETTEAPAEEPIEAGEPITVTDLAGREVNVPETVERVVAIGPGALRLVVYGGGVDKVVGVEDLETKPPPARPYILAHPELLELPIIGAGGPDSTPDAERLLGVEPDVVFAAQIADADAVEKLQAATGIPVLVVTYGSLGSFDEPFFVSLDLVGTVLGTTDDSDRVATYIRDTIDDLDARTADIDEADKPTAFVGALGFKGAHGLESTQADYPPFTAIGARNVVAEIDQIGSVMIDKEKLLEWNPEYLFVDHSGLSLVKEDAATNRVLYEELAAVTENRVYTQLPFNYYWTNVEVALANAYFAGTIMFPEQFSDVDASAKADEISTALVGAPVYEQLTEIFGGGFDRVDLLGDE